MNTLARLVTALLIAAGIAVGRGLERFRLSDRSVTVKGLTEKDVESDFAVWTLSFRRAGGEFSGVQQALAGDRDQVLAFLKDRGFTDTEVQARPLQVQDRSRVNTRRATSHFASMAPARCWSGRPEWPRSNLPPARSIP